MSNKIVFLVEFPPDQRDYERFGMVLLQQNGYDIQIWDFSKFLFPALSSTDRQLPDYVARLLTVFTREGEALKALAGLQKNTIVISLLSYSWKHWRIYRTLQHYGIVGVNSFPYSSPDIPSEKEHKISKWYLATNTIKKLFFKPSIAVNYIFRRIAKGGKAGVHSASFMIAGGKQDLQNSSIKFLIADSTDIVWCHSLDYDLYLKDKAENPIELGTHKKYAVFLDQFYPYHPEWKVEKSAFVSTPQQYFDSIEKFFQYIETQSNCEIIIAAHPRARYDLYPECYANRTVIQGETLQLVKNAHFVLAHDSTAVNMACIYNKPVIFFTTDGLQQSWLVSRSQKAIAAWFGKPLWNIDDRSQMQSFALEKAMEIDTTAYANYKESFIKLSGTPEKLCWQIVADYLKDVRN